MAHLRPPSRVGRLSPALLGAVLLVLSSCCDMLTRRVETLGRIEDLLARPEQPGDLSAATVQILRETELLETYRRTPAEAHHQLRETVAEDPRPESLLALAEVSQALARRAEKEQPRKAADYHYLAAGSAYRALMHKTAAGENTEDKKTADEDARFQRARDLYNASLTGWLRATGTAGPAEPPAGRPIPPRPVVRHGFAWRAEEFGPLLFCADQDSGGLSSQRSQGLGVPLICLHAPLPGERGQAIRYPRSLAFPVTAFLRFPSKPADPVGTGEAQLELHDPLLVRSVEMDGRVLPLETDLGAPLAYFRKHNDLEGMGDPGFLHPDRLRERRGVYLFEPYQPGKIPVLLIHGLRSSPATWLTLFHELRADPEIRACYQFWFCSYPSGDLYLKAAADLRQTLNRLRDDLDPQRRDPALDQMVVVGHSMGGIIGRLLTVEGGDDFWQRVAPRPFDSLRMSAETEAELRRMFFFEPQSGVRRVVYLATPHHGSKLSASLPARVTAQFSQPPKVLQDAARELVRSNPGLEQAQVQRLVPAGDHLGPGSPFLQALGQRPRPRGVAYHSIIGVAPLLHTVLERTLAASWEERGDGVVPADSAHLKDAESELVVPADHAQMKDHPRTIDEVKRILRAHLEGRGGAR